LFTLSSPFYVAAPLSRKPFKTHNNNENLKEIKDVRGPATEMIISPCHDSRRGGVGIEVEIEMVMEMEAVVGCHCWQRCCHCGHCSIAMLLQFSFGCRPSLAAVISDKRPGRKPRKRTGEIKQHERNLHI